MLKSAGELNSENSIYNFCVVWKDLKRFHMQRGRLIFVFASISQFYTRIHNNLGPKSSSLKLKGIYKGGNVVVR